MKLKDLHHVGFNIPANITFEGALTAECAKKIVWNLFLRNSVVVYSNILFYCVFCVFLLASNQSSLLL